MTPEERLKQLEQENRDLREQLVQQQEQIEQLNKHIQALEDRLAKTSRNSSLPPSSDRFGRQPKSLCKKSGKKTGGQPGHHGHSLMWSPTLEEVIVHPLHSCQHCHADLDTVLVQRYERRQVVDLSAVRLLVQEHQAECKQCPVCHQFACAPFPEQVAAPLQYGARVGAMAVYLVQHAALETGLRNPLRPGGDADERRDAQELDPVLRPEPDKGGSAAQGSSLRRCGAASR